MGPTDLRWSPRSKKNKKEGFLRQWENAALSPFVCTTCKETAGKSCRRGLRRAIVITYPVHSDLHGITPFRSTCTTRITNRKCRINPHQSACFRVGNKYSSRASDGCTA
ncbi:hypothetical protein MRB53_001355 [Persea americana]|uniref:Uncharacterized protein n=1 Tax=Persea americana TaxID=3435 RepID=A0ACC2MTT9_PERAE|nr:hypothetical protein MRB53_001355 [Persea americana]